MEEESQQVVLSGSGLKIKKINMKNWIGIAKKIFPNEYESFKKISGRNPDVKFSTIEKDVERRDIPYNALFFDLDKNEIVDLVGGVDDINSKITRFVGNPDLRIKEDPLRILRLLRFNCRYQFTIDVETSKAISKNKSTLSIISRERIWAFSGDNPGEIMKAWKQAKDFTEYFNLLGEYGLWSEIMPGIKINTKIKDSKFLENYLANLLIDNVADNKLYNKLIQGFKIEADIARQIIFLISLKDLTYERVLEMYKSKVSSRVSNDMIVDWYNMRDMNDVIFTAFLTYKPTVSAEDLMASGLKGMELGREIKKLESEKFKNLVENNV
jgi:tRNA nucleotidyltransferase/poly(A) polymerase